MLADDLELVDLDDRHLRGWLELLLPPGLRAEPTWALVVTERGEPIAAVVAGRGAVDLEEVALTGTSRPELTRARARLGVALLLVLEREAVARLFADAESELRLADHYTAQALTWLRAFRGQLRRGVWMDPPLADLIPPLATEPLERTFDLLVPDGSSALAYVIDDDRRSLRASAIGVKQGGRLAAVSSHLALADALPEDVLAPSWTTQYRRVLDLVADRFAEPSLAVFMERAALGRIITGPPDQLGRELGARRVIIDPMPRWLAALLGGASAAAFAGRGARRIGALLPARARRVAAGLAAEAGRQIEKRGVHPWQVLGFDPLDLWRQLRRYYA